MKKKFVSIVVAIFLLVTSFATLTGCGSSETTINVLLLANNNEISFYNEYFDQLEKELKEETGIAYDIVFDGLQEDPYQKQLSSKLQANKTPDIFYVRPNDILKYKNIIAPLQDYADSQDDVNLDDIYEVALDMYRFNPSTGELGNKNDPLYAFPKDLSTQQLGYNRNLLQKAESAIKAAGYDMPWERTAPYTWDEFYEILEIVRDQKESDEFVMDVPNLEVLAHAFAEEGQSPDLLDLSAGKVTDITKADNPARQAIDYQAKLIADGISSSGEGRASYANFTGGHVYFYGAIGSWEVGEYNEYLPKNSDGTDHWGLMPWPVAKEGDNWQGVITSAGYVVSKKCANSKKGDIAKRIALSFMTKATQEQMYKDRKISLPLYKNVKDFYVDPANDKDFSPSTRSIFMDVISGEHGFFPAKYSTYNDDWFKPLNTELTEMYKEGNKATAYFTDAKLSKAYKDMQDQYDLNKNK